MKIEVQNPAEVVKEAFWLAWKACERPHGMGVFQDRPNATKDEVWDCVFEKRDYDFDGKGTRSIAGFNTNRDGAVHGDYVFGRMMKLSLKWDNTVVEISDSTPRANYQSWCVRYPTTKELIEAAVASLK